MFTTKNKTAVEFFKQACDAEEKGELELAEVYYIKSGFAFEQAGKVDYLNAVTAFNALAIMRAARGNPEGALAAANKAAQIMDNYNEQPPGPDAELMCMTTRNLITNLISFEIESGNLIHRAG